MHPAMYAFIGIAVLVRLYQCTQVPANTGDVVRHLVYGVGVLTAGPALAGEAIIDFAPHLSWISWARNPYNYPPVALLFFSILTTIHSSVFAAKLLLTLFECINAWLVARITGDKWCGVIVLWAPAAIWWTSREGQYEVLQTFLALLAILALNRRFVVAAFCLLALAIQTKLLVVALLPWFLWKVWKFDDSKSKTVMASAAGFLAGCLPTFAALFFYPAVGNVLKYSTPMTLNLFHWLPIPEYMKGMPPGLDIWMQLAVWTMTGLLAFAVWKTRNLAALLPAILFLLIMRTSPHTLFWYWLAMIPMLVLIPDSRMRRWLFVAWMFVDGYSACELLGGPFSSTVDAGYYEFGLFTPVSRL